MTEAEKACRRVIDELYDYITGQMVICPKCGEVIRKDSPCSICGCSDFEEADTADIYNWIATQVLDVEYILNSDLSYHGVKVYVTMNGPTIWFDTVQADVFYSREARWGMYPECVEALNEYYEEELEILLNSRR